MTKTIGTVGRLEHRKGHDRVIHSMCSLDPSTKLKIVGRDQAHYGKVLRRLVKKLNLESRVELLGELSPVDVEGFLGQLDVFVLASREEGLGLAVLEAMKARVPVVVTDIPAFREIVQDHKTGLIARPQPYSIAWKINFLLRNPLYAANLVSQATEVLEKKFTKAKMLEELINVYESL